MERLPGNDRQAQRKRVFQACDERIQSVAKKWGGPDVPVFILPVNESSKEIREQFYFQSGMAFDDKIFLFIPAYTEGANRYVADA
ncbi:DUF2268 domain-containing putative Zn-dependent protease [Bacillus sp. B6(2022)]|nr:DUF2268 domain-containing putative Zn-dependent protease [Bacillus sp. B6(2022)]